MTLWIFAAERESELYEISTSMQNEEFYNALQNFSVAQENKIQQDLELHGTSMSFLGAYELKLQKQHSSDCEVH